MLCQGFLQNVKIQFLAQDIYVWVRPGMTEIAPFLNIFPYKNNAQNESKSWIFSLKMALTHIIPTLISQVIYQYIFFLQSFGSNKTKTSRIFQKNIFGMDLLLGWISTPWARKAPVAYNASFLLFLCLLMIFIFKLHKIRT